MLQTASNRHAAKAKVTHAAQERSCLQRAAPRAASGRLPPPASPRVTPHHPRCWLLLCFSPADVERLQLLAQDPRSLEEKQAGALLLVLCSTHLPLPAPFRPC